MMKVTGWTEWEDPNYIDITHENTRKRCDAMKDVPPFLKYDEIIKLTEEDREKYLKERDLAVAKAFENYGRSGEELEEEIREAVIIELREKGYHFTGDHHQGYSRGVPIIDDKYIYCVSMRTWGAIMAEAFPDEDYSQINDDAHRYCKWAWAGNPNLTSQIKLP